MTSALPDLMKAQALIDTSRAHLRMLYASVVETRQFVHEAREHCRGGNYFPSNPNAPLIDNNPVLILDNPIRIADLLPRGVEIERDLNR